MMRIVGTGTRVLNFLIDFPILAVLSFAVYKWWSFYVMYYHFTFIPVYYFLAAVGFLYYLILESVFKRTPGKWLTLTKVVNLQGGKPSFLQILVRSLVRVLGVILIDSIFLSFIDKTLHDYLSKTHVVEL